MDSLMWSAPPGAYPSGDPGAKTKKGTGIGSSVNALVSKDTSSKDKVVILESVFHNGEQDVFNDELGKFLSRHGMSSFTLEPTVYEILAAKGLIIFQTPGNTIAMLQADETAPARGKEIDEALDSMPGVQIKIIKEYAGHVAFGKLPV